MSSTTGHKSGLVKARNAVADLFAEDGSAYYARGEWKLRFVACLAALKAIPRALAILVERGEFVRRSTAPGTEYGRAQAEGLAFCAAENPQPYLDSRFNNGVPYNPSVDPALLQLIKTQGARRSWETMPPDAAGQKTEARELRNECAIINDYLRNEMPDDRREAAEVLIQWKAAGEGILIEAATIRADACHVILEAIRTPKPSDKFNVIATNVCRFASDLKEVLGQLLDEVEGELPPGPIKPAGAGPSKITASEANVRARNALKGRPPKGKRWTVRPLAKAIGCAEGQISKLPAWRAYAEGRGVRRNDGASPKAVAYTSAVEAVIGRDDTELKQLIAEHSADFEPSPLVGPSRHIARRKSL